VPTVTALPETGLFSDTESSLTLGQIAFGLVAIVAVIIFLRFVRKEYKL
jgi:hypothetical protein